VTAAVELLLGGGMELFLGLFGRGSSIVAARAWSARDVRPRAALLLGSVAVLSALLGTWTYGFCGPACRTELEVSWEGRR